MPTTKKGALIFFAVMAILFVFVLVHGTLGFVKPVEGHDVFVDVLHGAVWLAFLYAAWRLYAAFRGRPGAAP